MAKWCNDLALDAALNYIAGAERMVACSDQPADFAGVAAVALSDVAVVPADFTLADGLTSGRRLTVAAKGGVPVDAPGLVNHVALVDDTNSRLLYVTTTDNQEITSGSFVDFPEWSIEIADPV